MAEKYISASALFNRTTRKSNIWDIVTNAEGKGLTEIVNDIPAADVRPVVRGEWIVRQRHEHYPSGKPYQELVCPFCKKTDHNGDGCFCGYCGADMRKEKE